MNRVKLTIIILFITSALKGLSQDMLVNDGSNGNIYYEPINNNIIVSIDADFPVVFTSPFDGNSFNQLHTPPTGNYTTFEEELPDLGDPVENEEVPVDGGTVLLLTIGIGLGIANYQKKNYLNRIFCLCSLQPAKP